MAVKRRRSARKPAWGKLAIIALAVIALGAAWRYTPLAEYLTPNRIMRWARVVRETPWAPFALVAAYTPAAVVLFPRPLLTLLGVVAFGPWLGITYCAIGVMVAAFATYYAGRLMNYRTVERLAGARLDVVSKVLREHGVLALFALNQVPAPPFVVQGVIAGAVRVNVWHYALGSFLGVVPTLLAWTVFGDQLVGALEDPSNISWRLIAAVLIVFAVFTYIVRRWFAKQAGP